MKILYELSWLWETLGIALVAAACGNEGYAYEGGLCALPLQQV